MIKFNHNYKKVYHDHEKKGISSNFYDSTGRLAFCEPLLKSFPKHFDGYNVLMFRGNKLLILQVYNSTFVMNK